MSTFTDAVERQVTDVKNRMDKVARRSLERMIMIMQEPGWSVSAIRRSTVRSGPGAGQGPTSATLGSGGKIPVDTGFMRASLVVGPEPIRQSKDNPGGQFSWNMDPAISYIWSASLSKKIYATYGANYTSAVHWGANGHPGKPWITLAVQRWPQVVSGITAELARR